MKKLFDHSAVFGTEIFHHDDVADQITLETVADVEPIIDHNKRLANFNDGYSKSREFRRIASIPLNIIEKWRLELGVDVFNKDHAAKVRRLLNDPDWRYLRNSPGRY